MKIVGITPHMWPVDSVESHPEATLTRWRIVQLSNGDRHMYGYELSYQEGRVTSKIAMFNPYTLEAVTRSGRKYELIGPPGHNTDATYIWGVWCKRNDVENYIDISDTVYEEYLEFNPERA